MERYWGKGGSEGRVPLLAQRAREKWGTLSSFREVRKCQNPQAVVKSATRVGHPVTAKRLGERAEAAFLAKAAGMGFGVAKPWGDSDRYDFIVDAGGRLWKVQVKSAYRVGRDGGYSVRTFGHSLGAYKEDEIDALVVYVAPEEAWYVFPAEVFRGRRSVKLYPGSRRRRSKFEQWREGWRVMGG